MPMSVKHLRSKTCGDRLDSTYKLVALIQRLNLLERPSKEMHPLLKVFLYCTQNGCLNRTHRDAPTAMSCEALWHF